MSITDPPRPPELSSAERQRMKDAAYAAKALWPGAVGELVCKELVTWDLFGFRLDQFGLAWRLVADVEAEQARRREQSEQAWRAYRAGAAS